MFRRVGDNTPRTSRFMLIGATTKPLTDLLETFLRRMPVLISMPTLSDRPMSIKREVRGVLSPTRRNTPVSSREKNISCPVDDRPWISSRNRIPPFACSTRPGLSSSAPVNAPFL